MEKASKQKAFKDMTPEELFRYEVQHYSDFLQRELDKWHAEFAKDPLYQLEWADKAYQYAAQLRVQRMLELHIKDDLAKGLEEFLERAKDEAWRGAKWPSRSTSQCTNLAKECLTSAWAEAYEKYSNTLAKLNQ